MNPYRDGSKPEDTKPERREEAPLLASPAGCFYVLLFVAALCVRIAKGCL